MSDDDNEDKPNSMTGEAYKQYLAEHAKAREHVIEQYGGLMRLPTKDEEWEMCNPVDQPSPDMPVSTDAFVANLIRFPANATQRDREDLAALYRDLNDPALREAAMNCIDEIIRDCEERL